jgi:hypothetical protein
MVRLPEEIFYPQNMDFLLFYGCTLLKSAVYLALSAAWVFFNGAHTVI